MTDENDTTNDQSDPAEQADQEPSAAEDRLPGETTYGEEVQSRTLTEEQRESKEYAEDVGALPDSQES